MDKRQLCIENAKIVRPQDGTLVDADIYVEEGRIKAIKTKNKAEDGAICPKTCVKYEEHGTLKDRRIIDAGGNVLFPGFIDPHVHFDDPGFTFREDFETGTKSAAAGGVTCVIDMPCTSIPPVTCRENFENKLSIVAPRAYVDFAFFGGVTPRQVGSGEYINTLEDLKQKGIVGVKFYTVSGMELYPRMEISEIDKAFRKLKELNLVCAVHAEEYNLVNYYSNLMQQNNELGPAAWCQGRAYEAEPAALWQVVGVTRKVKNKLHIVHLSSKAGLEIIRWAKSQGLDVTTETCPHYLLFTMGDFEKMGAILKIAPPLRFEEDRRALWEGLKDGSIDFISTDHAAGAYPEEKSDPNIWQDYAGIPGTQTMAAALLTYGYNKGSLSLLDIQNLLGYHAALRYGLYPRKGVIEVGADADFALVDLGKEWILDPEKLETKGKYSPLAGKKLKGKVIMTILRGEVIYEDGKGIVGNKGYGKFIPSNL